MYVTDAINNICSLLSSIRNDLKITKASEFGVQRKQVYNHITNNGKTAITEVLHFSDDLSSCDKDFKNFLTSRILQSELAQSMDGKATYIIRQLVKAYLRNPQQLPDATIIRLVGELETNDIEDKLDDSKEDATVASQARNILQNALVNNPVKIRHILLRIICDYIAGMTDQYAYKQFNKLFGTGMLINN